MILNDIGQIAESLKKYNRSDLEDSRTAEGRQKNILALKSCFVDPLGDNKILNDLSKKNHVFLVGRRGTGKSTLFLRSQIEIQETRNGELTAYVDVNSLYEMTRREIFAGSLNSINDLKKSENVAFLVVLLGNIFKSIFEPISKSYTNDTVEPCVSEEKRARIHQLTEVLSTVVQDNFSFDINSLITSVPVQLDAEALATWSVTKLKLVEALQEIEKSLLKANFTTLHVFIDDFNELPVFIQEYLQKYFLETIYSTAGKWIFFKVAKYPGMISYGTVDIKKTETIHLDFHDLFRTYFKEYPDRSNIAKRNIANMLRERGNFILQKNIEIFFSDFEKVIDIVFDITLGNPRYVGWILDYCIKLLKEDDTIDSSIVEKASLNYFSVKIQPLIERTAQMQRPFNLKVELYSAIELLRKITAQAREIRSIIPKQYEKYKDLKKPPTSHFYVSSFYEELLEVLELNLFLNKVREAKTKDGKNVLIYSLNHGLCLQQIIEFGRLVGGKYRDYQIENIFNYNTVLTEHLKESIRYACRACSTEYTKEQYEAYEQFAYDCPKCRSGANSLTKIAKSPLAEIARHKFSTIEEFDEPTLDLIYNLKDDDTPKPVVQIAAETDYSYQLLMWRNKKLTEKGITTKSTVQIPGKGDRIAYSFTEDGAKIKDRPHDFLASYLMKTDEEVVDELKTLDKYDIAISFAGEDRGHAEAIAEACRKKSIKIFYDEFEIAKLWGKDLFQFLSDLYQNKATFCLILVSENYNKKIWSRHELKAAQSKSIELDREYILPLIVDESKSLPNGVLNTTGYIKISDYSSEEIVNLLKEKLDAFSNGKARSVLT